MMSTLNIPINDSIREFTIILMFSFLVRILKGLNVLSNLIILRLIEERSISNIEMQTMKKSSLFQLLLR